MDVTLGVVVLADRASAACAELHARVSDGLLRSHPIMQNPPSREHPPSGIVIRWGARVSKRKGQRLLSVRRRSLAASPIFRA